MSFFVVVIVVLSLMYGYIGWRMITPAAFGFPVNLILWAIVAICLALPFLPVILRLRNAEGVWIDILAWVGYLSFGFFTLLFAFLFSKDIIMLLISGVHKLIQVFNHNTATVNPERRLLLTNALNLGVLGVTGALMGYGMYQAMRKPDIVEITVPIENLTDDLNGFKIVQITDIHASHTIKRRFIQTVVDQVNGLKPDLVALTGDLVDGSVEQLRDDVAPLADLKAPYGLYFVTGNHDYYSGIQQWLAETARLGFTILINEHKLIERGEGRLLLAGVTDFSGGQFSPDHISDPLKAMAGAPGSHAKILLAHQPKSIFKAAEAGFDYVISGHTHGGQYFPYHFLGALTQPYISGFHNYNGTNIYVSRGTGYWGPPLRIGAKSEITVHKLVRA